MFRSLLALGAFFVLAVAFSACGNGVPGDAVVSVDGSAIKTSTFDHWLSIAAHSSQAPGATAQVTVPDAPDFKKCIASKQKTSPAPAKGQPKQTPAQFKAQCQQEYAGLRDQVLTFLIQNKWLSGEASDLGVKVSDKDVQKDFERQKKQSFPTAPQFKQFLKTSGYTMDDLLFQVRGNLYEKGIRAKVTSGKDKVSDKQIADYYAKNKSRFAQPQRRDLDVVLTKTKAKADQAKAALAGGQSFAKVAKRSSIDQASKAQGGKLPSVTPGQQEKAFDTAIFGARKGKLVGPVKTQFGYYVFKVTNITPASQQTLLQARETIRTQLKSQNQQTALAAFVKKFQKKWKSRTNCRKGFIIASCKNAPKPKAGTQTAPPGAVPQTGGAQQVPQSGGAQQVPQSGGAQQVPQSGGAQQVPQTGTGQ